MDAPVSRLVLTTYGRVVDNHTTDFLHLAPTHRQGILAQVAGLASRLFERFVVSPSCSRRYRRGCFLFTFPPSLVIHGWFEARFSCVLHFLRWCRFPEARGWRKLRVSPSEQNLFAFHWKHSPVFRLVKEFCPFPLVTAARSVIFALNPEIYTSSSLFNMQFHTHSYSVIISVSSYSQNFLILLCHNCLSLGGILQLGNVQTFKNCPMEDHLLITVLAPNINQNPECRPLSNLILNSSDNPWISS